MDDVQFNASLDALLANEDLNDTGTGAVHGAYNADQAPDSDGNGGQSYDDGNMNLGPSYGYFGGTGPAGGYGATATATNPSASTAYCRDGNGTTSNNNHLATAATVATATAGGAATMMPPPYGSAGGPSSYPAPLAPPPFSSITIDNRLYAGTPGTAPTASAAFHNHQGAVGGPAFLQPFQSSGASISSSGSARSRRRGGGATGSVGTETAKRARDDDNAMAVSEDEEDRDKRRQGRNQREQERSHRITEQIDDLREVLAGANIPFKPDKYSTLVTVAEYIGQLQKRSAMLDAEHKRLIDTISKTNEAVDGSRLASSGPGSDGRNGNGDGGTHPDAAPSSGGHRETTIEEDELAFVRNVDYKSIFQLCGTPLAVASIDGRFLDCNYEFEALTGYSRDELLPMEGPDKMIADAVPSDSYGSSSSGSSNDEPEDERGPRKHAASDTSQDDQGDPQESSSSEDGSSISTGTNFVAKRNQSLFNLLSRDHMEDVFMALSEMLKHVPEEQNGTAPERKDFWNGMVRLNRNTDVEVRLVDHRDLAWKWIWSLPQ